MAVISGGLSVFPDGGAFSLFRDGGGGGGGGGGTITATTHWMFLFVAQDGPWSTINELALKTSPGGASITSTATLSQSAAGSLPALYDGSDATDWTTGSTAGAGGSWIRAVFADPTLLTDVDIKSGSSVADAQEAPRCVAILASYDSGTTWRLCSWTTGSAWSASQTRTFLVGTTFPDVSGVENARAWRYSVTKKMNNATSGGYIAVQQSIWSATSGGAQLAVSGANGAPFANTNFSYAEGPRNLVDGTPTGGVAALTRSGAAPPWRQGFAWAVPTQPAFLTLYAASNASEAQFAPKDFTIEYSGDGWTWTTATTITNAGFTAGTANQAVEFTI